MNICKSCKKYANDNRQMRSEGMPVITGDYCIKFAWNLKGMTRIPGDCFE